MQTRVQKTKASSADAPPGRSERSKAAPPAAAPTRPVVAQAGATSSASSSAQKSAAKPVVASPAKAASESRAAKTDNKPDTKLDAKSEKAKAGKAKPIPPIGDDDDIDELSDRDFLGQQRILLSEERATYNGQAIMLRAEADQLAADMEPGEVQFDDESGEGATVNVEREFDLAMSAQAASYVEEIDRAVARLDAGTYGLCDGCAKPIPRLRLRALPFAVLCVACKNGGLSRR